MKELRSVSGIYRNIEREFRGVSGVWREIAECHRNVAGVWRKYFGGCPVGSAVIRLYQTTGNTNGLTVNANGYSHGSSDDGFTAKFILDLYDKSGNMINYTLLSDIAGLDKFELSVSTSFMLFSGSGTANDNIFGVNAYEHEVWSDSAAIAKGDFKGFDKTKKTLIISPTTSLDLGVNLTDNSFASYACNYLKSQGFTDCDYMIISMGFCPSRHTAALLVPISGT